MIYFTAVTYCITVAVTEFTLKHFFSISTGLFNAGDKVLIALEIFLEWRELFKKGVPLSMIIECKMKSLLCTVPKVCRSSSNLCDQLKFSLKVHVCI